MAKDIIPYTRPSDPQTSAPTPSHDRKRKRERGISSFAIDIDDSNIDGDEPSQALTEEEAAEFKRLQVCLSWLLSHLMVLMDQLVGKASGCWR